MKAIRPKSEWLPTVAFATIAANIISLSLMEFLELPTRNLGAVYASIFIIAGCGFRFMGIQLPSISVRTHWLVFGGVVLLTIPRLAYAFEPLLGYSVDAACWDDWGHVQEFASIVYSPHFPPQSTFVHGEYLSFYFAPWMAGAVLFQLLPLATIKQAILLTDVLYNFCFLYFAVYAAKLAFPGQPKGERAFFAVTLLYGGFGIFYGLFMLLRGSPPGELHAEWWAAPLGFQIQYSSTAALLLWVPHHLIGALAILFGYFCLRERPSGSGAVAAGISFAFAGFSSVFATIGAIPILAYLLFRRRIPWKWQLLAGSVAFLLGLPLFWMYLERTGSGFIFFGELRKWWPAHKAMALGAFLIILILNFFPLLLAIGLKYRDRDFDRPLLFIALGYLLSNFVIAFSNFNNFAMRGAIVPIFALYYLATPGLRQLFQSPGTGVLYRYRYWLLFYFLGGLWEYGNFTTRALHSALQSSELRRATLASNRVHGERVDSKLLAAAEQTEYGWYALENMKPVDKPVLLEPDMELVNKDNRYRLTLKRLLP